MAPAIAYLRETAPRGVCWRRCPASSEPTALRYRDLPSLRRAIGMGPDAAPETRAAHTIAVTPVPPRRAIPRVVGDNRPASPPVDRREPGRDLAPADPTASTGNDGSSRR